MMKTIIKNKIIRYFLSVTFSVVFLMPVFGQQQLDNYLKMAAENNQYIKSLFSRYMAALEKGPQVGTLPDPQLAFGYFIEPVETKLGPQEFKIGLTQMFPWFGKLNAQEKAAAEMAKARYEIFREAKYKLFYDVKSVYYSLYVLEQAIRITKENMDILRSFKELALIKYESGETSLVDELRIEMEIAELENQLAYLKDNKLPIQAEFYQLLNMKEKVTIILPESLWQDTINISKEALYESILIQRPFLKKLNYQASSWEKKISVARRSGLPSFSLGADYISIGETTGMSITNSGQDAIILPRVGVTIPLYRRKYGAMAREARMNMEAVQFEKTDMENNLATKLEKGYRDYMDARRRVDLYKHLSGLAKQSIAILIAGYTSAGKDFEEVLRMERMILKYDLELEKARADQNTAVAYLQYLMGKQ